MLYEIGEDFADGRGELEAVSAESTRETDLRIVRMHIDDEVPIGRDGVHADHRFGAFADAFAGVLLGY